MATFGKRSTAFASQCVANKPIVVWRGRLRLILRSDRTNESQSFGLGKALLSKRVFFRGLPILFRHFLRASLPHDGHSAWRVLDFALLLLKSFRALRIVVRLT